MELFFWRTRAQSEIDLVTRGEGVLRAYEAKWSSRRAAGRAFREAYGVDTQVIAPVNPFGVDVFSGR
ncbi:MAG: hypothetical protein ACKVQK_13575 [Burkholderiales bacterium]